MMKVSSSNKLARSRSWGWAPTAFEASVVCRLISAMGNLSCCPFQGNERQARGCFRHRIRPCCDEAASAAEAMGKVPPQRRWTAPAPALLTGRPLVDRQARALLKRQHGLLLLCQSAAVQGQFGHAVADIAVTGQFLVGGGLHLLAQLGQRRRHPCGVFGQCRSKLAGVLFQGAVGLNRQPQLAHGVLVGHPPVKAPSRSRPTRPAACAACSEPGTAAVALAALTDALKALKKSPVACVTSAADEADDSWVKACAAVWLLARADLSCPNDDSWAVVAVASAWMRVAALESAAEAAAMAPVACVA